MKTKSLLLTIAATFGMSALIMAQNLPNYVPSNGLVGWWPFNGNANDESGNNNNGTVNGATLTSDRFGNVNKAYNFDGNNDYVQVNQLCSQFSTNKISVSIWTNTNQVKVQSIFQDVNGSSSNRIVAHLNFINNGNTFWDYGNISNGGRLNCNIPSTLGIWEHYIFIADSSNQLLSIYKNGNLVCNDITANPNFISSILDFSFGGSSFYPSETYSGKLDDIGIWNRVLTECEIADLYNSQFGSFSNSTVSINQISSTIGSNATLTVSTPIQNLQWQSNPGNMGWNNVLNNNNYSGSTNDTLVVSKLQLSNHNQPFRVLACGDTSNIATIQIADTCITNVTVYDTLLTTVTDTLIINTTLSLPAPNNENTILIYPNPAKDHITIYNGNFTAMIGYSIKITNNAGQEVFLKAINKAQFYVDLSTWSGNGLYFVHLIDPQNNTVTVKKIVLQ